MTAVVNIAARGLDMSADEIRRLRALGLSWRGVTAELNRAGIPTPSGRGQWYPQTVIRHADPAARAAWNAYMRRYRAGFR